MSFKNARIIGPVENPKDYFTQKFPRGDSKFEMSVSALKEFNWCPKRWFDGYESPETKSKDYGSLLDTLILTPQHFKRRYVIRPDTYKDEKGKEKDWHHASNTCKEWLADQKAKGLEPVTNSEVEKATKAARCLMEDKILSEFLIASDKQVWVAADWFDEVTGITAPVKCMIDLLPRADSAFYKNVADFKTAESAHNSKWPRQVFNWKYHWQGAFNLDIVRAALPKEDRCQFCHIVQESYQPFQVGRRIMSEKFLEIGRAEYTRALNNYCWCIKNKKWPDYDDNDESSQGWTITEPEPWMEGAALFGIKFKTEVEEVTEQTETFDVAP